MAVTYGFFNSVNGDRKYNAEQMSEYFRGIINEGVYQHLDGGLAVTAGTGLAVNVAAGRAIIQNRWVQNSAAMSLTIAAASETYARKDAVVIRLNWSSRAISIAVKTGTPAASPVAPSMTRNSTTYEMALAYVNVAANATSVTVTDKRSDSTVCGWVTVAQSTSGEVDAMLNDMKTGFDGVVYQSPGEAVRACDQLLQDQIDDLTAGDDPVGKAFYLSKLYYSSVGKLDQTKTPTYEGQTSNNINNGFPTNGKKILMVCEINNTGYAKAFGALNGNGSSYYNASIPFSTISGENIIYATRTISHDDENLRVIYSASAVGNEVIISAECFDITDYTGTVNDDFVTMLFTRNYPKLGYDDLKDAAQKTDTVYGSNNIVEELPEVFGAFIKSWTPTFSGAYASASDKDLVDGKKYLIISEVDNVNHFEKYGVVKNGSWHSTNIGINKISASNIAWVVYTANTTGSRPAIIIDDSAINVSVSASSKTYDITNLTFAITNDFVLHLFSGNAFKLNYYDLKIATPDNWYKGKELTCFGDSWTAQDTFRTRLHNYFGFQTVNNCGIGGTRLTGNGSTAFPSDDRINSIPLTTDVLTILGGANDSVYGTISAGAISFANIDLNSVCGALNVILSKIYYRFKITATGYYNDIDYSGITQASEKKELKIFIATCCGRYDGTGYADNARVIADGIRKTANLWGIPVIDLAYEAGINDVNYAQYLGDSVHPNDLGDELVSNVFVNTMKNHAPHDYS